MEEMRYKIIFLNFVNAKSIIHLYLLKTLTSNINNNTTTS